MELPLKIFFSVVIPLYNKELYVERAIRSVLAQSYAGFEIIVVDDGSTDRGALIVQDITIKEDKVRLIKQRNAGVAAARNEGIRNARFDYVAFLDADDEWSPLFLRRLVDLIVDYPGAGLYGINHEFIFPDGSRRVDVIRDILADAGGRGYIRDYFDAFQYCGRSPFSNSGCCMPRAVLDAIGGYKNGVALTEDSHLWCRIALLYPIAYCADPLVRYYVETPTSSIHREPPEMYEVTSFLRGTLAQGALSEKHVRSVSRLAKYLQLSLAKRALLGGHRRKALGILSEVALISYKPFTYIQIFCLLAVPTCVTRFVAAINRRIRKAASS